MKVLVAFILWLLVCAVVGVGNSHSSYQSGRPSSFSEGESISSPLVLEPLGPRPAGKVTMNREQGEKLGLARDTQPESSQIRLALTFQEADAMRRGVWKPPPGRCCVYRQGGQTFRDWLSEEECRSLGGQNMPAGPTECGRPDLGPR